MPIVNNWRMSGQVASCASTVRLLLRGLIWRRAQSVVKGRLLELALLATPGLAIVTGALIARVAGPAGRGEIVIIATWGQAVGWAAGFSLDKSLLFFGRGAYRERLPALAGAVIVLLAPLVMASVAAAFVVGTLLLDDPVLTMFLVIVAVGTMLMDYAGAAALLRSNWTQYSLVRVAQPAAYLVGASTVAVLSTFHEIDRTRLFGAALAVSVAVPTAFLAARHWVPPAAAGKEAVRHVAKYALSYHPGSLLQFLSSRVDLLVLPYLFDLESVGLYAVAISAGQLVALLGSAALMRGLTGHSSGVDVRGFVLAAGLAALVIVVAPFLVPVIFGEAFEASVRPAQVLCLSGLAVYLLQGITGRLAVEGRPLHAAGAHLLGVLTSLVLLINFAQDLITVAIVNLASTCLALSAGAILLRASPRGNPGSKA